MAPAHESETIVFNFRKLLSTLPNYAERVDDTLRLHDWVDDTLRDYMIGWMISLETT
jgi:hypothetical protein